MMEKLNRSLDRVAVRRIAIAAAVLLVPAAGADAMNFTWHDHLTVHALGPIEEGDAAKFAALPKFDTLELDSPGGLVGEALAMAANMDARGGIRTVVKPGAECASACANVLFVSGATRVVYWGGRLGIHSCYKGNEGGDVVIPDPECNAKMAANAIAHGVPWGVVKGFSDEVKPSSIMWLSGEDAECWGFMKWSDADDSHGIACFMAGVSRANHRPPLDVTAQNANDVTCRLNAGFSRIYVPNGNKQQGFSDPYRKACERVAVDPKTPPYAAIDILLWLSLTDPGILAIKPGTVVLRIMNDKDNLENCWKCYAIMGMSITMHGGLKDALPFFQSAVTLVKRDTGSVPAWLTSRINLVAAEAAKRNR
jgi:hypothetical protein